MKDALAKREKDVGEREKKAEHEWELIRIEWEKLRNQKPTVISQGEIHRWADTQITGGGKRGGGRGLQKGYFEAFLKGAKI